MESRLLSIPNLLWDKLPQWAFYVLYAIVYFCALPFFQHQMDVDTIGYIAAAEHYAEGNLLAGINGYWSPLLSWLLVPFLSLKVPALLAIKLIDLLAGIVTLTLIASIARQLHFNSQYTRLCMLIAMPHLAMYSLCVATPDVLACMSWMGVACYALKFFTRNDHIAIANLAVWGAISYFAKYYHFYAFLLLLAVLMIAVWIASRNKKAVLAYLQAAVLFLVIAGAWMFAIYTKHGVFTPTTAASHNLYTAYSHLPNIPQAGEHLLPLDYDKYSYTAWEYVPDYLVAVNVQTNIGPGIHTMARHAFHNAMEGPLYFYFEFALFLISIVVLFKVKALRNNICLTALLLATLIYPAGYFITTVDYRYLLFCVIASLILSMFALQVTHSRAIKIIIGVLLAGSFLLPFHRINQFAHKGGKYLLMNEFFNDSQRLKGEHIMSSPRAWSRGIALAYQAKAKYYDTLLPERVQPSINELKQHGITYYLCLRDEIPAEMANYPAATFDQYALIYLAR